MIYRIQEKFWSLGDQFTITDGDGRDMYRVVGKAFSWGNKLSFQNLDGQELAFINQKLISLKPRYEIQIDGEVFAEVTKEWSWFKQSFSLDVPGPNDYTITGSFWSHEFEFERLGRTVAKISKTMFAWADSYGIEVEDDEDHLAILCTCIIIDQVLEDQAGGASAGS